MAILSETTLSLLSILLVILLALFDIFNEASSESVIQDVVHYRRIAPGAGFQAVTWMSELMIDD